MLCLSRKVGERIVIGGETIVQVLEVRGNRVKLGITIPDGVTVFREELLVKEKEPAHARS